MRVLGTSIEYDTITRGERLGAFWLELAHKKVARILKTNTDREFALYSFQTKDYFMVVWDDSLKTFRKSSFHLKNYTDKFQFAFVPYMALGMEVVLFIHILIES